MYIIDKLDNGIRVVMERIPYVNSVSIGVIVDNGSAKEDKHNNGVSHFIEHMLFKGTGKRTAKNIAETIDNIGGQLNAFTGKETTCYYAKVLYNHIDIAIDVLADMLTNSNFSESDIEKEKAVIIEEINMYLDSPEDMVSELLNEIMFKDTSLGHPILGIEESIKNLNKEKIINYFFDSYIPENIVISLAGKIDTKEVFKMLNHYFGNFNDSNKCNSRTKNTYRFTNKLKGINKSTEQLNFCIGMEGLPIISENIEALLVLNNIFGGSMSSRLFQKIREDLGLAYAIESYPSFYKDTGILSIYTGLHPAQLLKTVKYIGNEIDDIRKNLISKDELDKSKEHLKGSYVLGMEGTFSRMYEIGKSILIFNKVQSPDEILNRISKVNLSNIEEIIKIIFNKETINIAYVGDIKNQKLIEQKIKNILF
ncbi:Predicted Zn-dependent peptidase [Tissierella praeacuta DSM 18095]|uniref:Predicted Zn-dependent peptidase n=1 Tax=Tissierella praeacuta DSM 18095 TaxID=1123404 RepID=A0A1M4SI58_9FIRM|nr:pitrilysin family protein [Tissierella praeacuta]SHE31895.1 Predicted Zn-dependent peptidase [Tissierella praeacuta DSM 18095]SUP01453.1 Protease 3 precursor [Tissierella praeacuta]